MKSERANKYIDNDTIEFRNGDRMVDASTAYIAVELAEQEAESRMRQKAIEAFDDMWFSGFEPDYEYHRENFIKKLKEE